MRHTYVSVDQCYDSTFWNQKPCTTNMWNWGKQNSTTPCKSRFKNSDNKVPQIGKEERKFTWSSCACSSRSLSSTTRYDASSRNNHPSFPYSCIIEYHWQTSEYSLFPSHAFVRKEKEFLNQILNHHDEWSVRFATLLTQKNKGETSKTMTPLRVHSPLPHRTKSRWFRC